MSQPILCEREFTPAQTAQKHYRQTDPKVTRASAEARKRFFGDKEEYGSCQTFAPGIVDTVFADSLPDVREPPPLTGKACCGRYGEPFHVNQTVNSTAWSAAKKLGREINEPNSSIKRRRKFV